MLYLMLDESRGKKFAKVGYSKGGVKNRRNHYKTHNPTAIMRSSCAGSTTQEKKCQTVLFSIGVRLKGSEWAEIPESLFNILNEKGMGYFFPKQNPIHFIEEW